MSLPRYCVFVCTKQRSANDPEGCCCNTGALQIYQAFQSEVQQRQLRFVDRDAWIAVKLEQSRWSINRASMSLLGFPRSCD
jgi:hypothetical protein